jgi:pimeloyl-ACP methyl ester carboxylesterase
MPHAALEVMPGVAHLPALEAPEAFNARLDRYLQAL